METDIKEKFQKQLMSMLLGKLKSNEQNNPDANENSSTVD